MYTCTKPWWFQCHHEFFSTLAFQQQASAATAIFKPPQPLKRVPQRGPPKPTGFTTQTFCSNRQVRKHCLKPDLHLIKTRLPLFILNPSSSCVSVSIHKQLIQTFSQIWESPMLLGLVGMTWLTTSWVVILPSLAAPPRQLWWPKHFQVGLWWKAYSSLLSI